MFGNKTRELEQKIAALEQQLQEAQAAHAAEQIAHAADKKALEDLQERIKLEELTFSELQGALRQRVQEVDEKAKRYEKEMDDIRQNLETEVADRRAALEEELAQRRQQDAQAVQEKIQTFSNNYSVYLSQVQQAVNHLNATALQLSQSFLQQDEDINTLFQDQLTAPFKPSDTIVDLDAQPEDDSSFLLREGGPAKSETQL